MSAINKAITLSVCHLTFLKIHQVDDNVINLHLKLSSGVGLGLKRKPSFPGKGNRNYIKFVLDEVFSPTEWSDVGQITPQVR